MVSAICMFAILWGVAGLCAVLSSRKIEEWFAFAIFMVVAVLYLFALAGVPVWGYYAVTCAGLGALAATCALAIAQKPVRRWLLTPGSVAFVLLVGVAWWAHRGQPYLYQDEFSHWGRAINRLYALNVLPNTVAGAVDFPSYPPASTLFYAFWTWQSRVFSEGNTITASNVWLVSCFLPLMKYVEWKQWKRFLPTVLICVMLPMVFYPTALEDVYVDVLLGCVAAYALIQWFTAPKDFASLLMIGAALTILPLIKESGTGIALLALAMMALDVWREERGGARRFAKLLPLVGGTLLAAVSWKLFLHAYGIVGEKPFRYWEIGQNFMAFLHGTSPWYQKYLATNFFKWLTWPAMMGGGHILSIGYTEWLLLFATVACVLGRRENGHEKRYGRVVWLLIAATMVYAVMLFHIYLYAFIHTEAASLHSFDRYMASIMTMAAGTTAALILQAHQHRPFRLLPASLVLVLTLGLLVNPAHVMELTFTAPAAIAQAQEERNAVNPAQYVADVLTPEDRVAGWRVSLTETASAIMRVPIMS